MYLHYTPRGRFGTEDQGQPLSTTERCVSGDAVAIAKQMTRLRSRSTQRRFAL
jgi:hypothetical protein